MIYKNLKSYIVIIAIWLVSEADIGLFTSCFTKSQMSVACSVDTIPPNHSVIDRKSCYILL